VNHAAQRKFDAPSQDTVATGEVAAWARPRATRKRAQPVAQTRSVGDRPRSPDTSACQGNYLGAEIELMRAMAAYKESSGRMFPTWSEVLEVIKGLGYRKQD
jgi:hypothetical protein